MQYKYIENDNFEDFACGRVIKHKPGFTNFPVRLAQEIFLRSVSFLEKKDNLTIYDPCCGGGYLLTVLGLLNFDMITAIYGSDINPEAVNHTMENIELLTISGMERRIKYIENLYHEYQKTSHQDAIKSAKNLKTLLNPNVSIHTNIFENNILDVDDLKNQDFKADIVITDVPYGNMVSWNGNESSEDFIRSLLDNLIPILNPGAIVAICSDKKQKFLSDKFARMEKQLIGKRKFEIFRYK
jgi:23S rRNA (guanine2535-N1)-methyltransferase